MHAWTLKDSLELYHVELWGSGFFGINEAGNAVVRPLRGEGPELDLKGIVDELLRRGYSLPFMLRFSDIIRSRIEELGGCFRRAMQDFGFEGSYQGLYPIKVNQQRDVVEELLQCGREQHLGIEVGSKPELLIALALLDDPQALLVCNGYKDREYVEMALLAQKLGRRAFLVVDRFHELELVLRQSARLGIRPLLGLRTKLQARGAGHWAESGGSRSKFGLNAAEMVETIRVLEQESMLDCLQLLHFHIGSQIPAISTIKEALREGSRVFVELHALGAHMRYMDVGGGLAVDYDGSNTNFHSSMNYSVQEYANDVVVAVLEACDARKVPHPTILTEAGRALVAHHSVLVCDVLDTAQATVSQDPPPVDESDHRVVHDLHETWTSITGRNLLEPFHDAQQLREEASQLFKLGYLDLEARARAERLFFASCTRIRRYLRELQHVPEELLGLERWLADTFYCNFSVFQSIPDSWAVGQLFPIMPLQRLLERPSRQATLADLTCDSDGKVDHFIDIHDVKRVLDLHPPNGAPYYIGTFLVGAYQEILGDLHNLFGDTHAVHIALEDGRYRVKHVVAGDRVKDVLGYVDYDRRELMRRIRTACEESLWHEHISLEESALLQQRFESGLSSYTYLARSSNGERARKSPDRAPEEAPESTPRSGS